MHRLTGYIEKDPETGLYVAVVPGIPGAHTQVETLDELYKNLKEVVELCLQQASEKIIKIRKSTKSTRYLTSPPTQAQ